MTGKERQCYPLRLACLPPRPSQLRPRPRHAPTPAVPSRAGAGVSSFPEVLWPLVHAWYQRADRALLLSHKVRYARRQPVARSSSGYFAAWHATRLMPQRRCLQRRVNGRRRVRPTLRLHRHPPGLRLLLWQMPRPRQSPRSASSSRGLQLRRLRFIASRASSVVRARLRTARRGSRVRHRQRIHRLHSPLLLHRAHQAAHLRVSHDPSLCRRRRQRRCSTNQSCRRLLRRVWHAQSRA